MKRTIALLLAATLAPAWAALGGSPGPAAGGTPTAATTPSGAAYTRLQRTLDSGTTVQEYVDASGTVFAVSWSGPYLPDLRALLGPSFEVLVQQQASSAGHNSALSVQRPDVAILSAGRMGAFQGRAWLPPRLPAGFDTKVLQ